MKHATRLLISTSRKTSFSFNLYFKKKIPSRGNIKKMTDVTSKRTDYNHIDSNRQIVKDAKIYIHTGNIANWANVRSRKSNDMPANELHQSLYRTLHQWSEHDSQVSDEEVFVNCVNKETMNQKERGLLKVTAKIFLHTLNPKALKEAVGITLKQLGLQSVDSLYLALPPLNENIPFHETLLQHWEEMESLHDAGIASQISSCDLDREKLQNLVERVKIRPEVNQVNLTSCCHMPEELVQYAKQLGVVLHTHGDQPVMLPDENAETLMNSIQLNNNRTFTTKWVVRYAVVIKCRGVIKSKGYIAAIDAKQNE